MPANNSITPFVSLFCRQRNNIGRESLSLMSFQLSIELSEGCDYRCHFVTGFPRNTGSHRNMKPWNCSQREKRRWMPSPIACFSDTRTAHWILRSIALWPAISDGASWKFSVTALTGWYVGDHVAEWVPTRIRSYIYRNSGNPSSPWNFSTLPYKGELLRCSNRWNFGDTSKWFSLIARTLVSSIIRW